MFLIPWWFQCLQKEYQAHLSWQPLTIVACARVWPRMLHGRLGALQTLTFDSQNNNENALNTYAPSVSVRELRLKLGGDQTGVNLSIQDQTR